MKNLQPSLHFFKKSNLGFVGSSSYEKMINLLTQKFPWVIKIPSGDNNRLNPFHLSTDNIEIAVTETSYHLFYIFKFEVTERRKQTKSYYAVFHVDTSTVPTVLNIYFFPVTPENAIISTKKLPVLIDDINSNLIWVSNYRQEDERKIYTPPNLHLFNITDHNLLLIASFFLTMIKTYKET